MRTGRLAIGALALISLSTATAWAVPAYVTSTVNLRSAAGTSNEIVAKIPAGSLVDASNCNDGWCEVAWQGKTGFAIQTALDTSGRVPPRATAARRGAPRGYVIEDDDEVVVGPPVGYYGGPYYYGGYRPYGYWGYGGYGWRGGYGYRRRW